MRTTACARLWCESVRALRENAPMRGDHKHTRCGVEQCGGGRCSHGVVNAAAGLSNVQPDWTKPAVSKSGINKTILPLSAPGPVFEYHGSICQNTWCINRSFEEAWVSWPGTTERASRSPHQ